MNVLIVEKDKRFGNWLCNTLQKSDEVKLIKCVFSVDDFKKLDNTYENYELCFFDVDSFKQYLDNLKDLFNIDYLIGFSENNRAFSKYINSSVFERIFKKPFDVIDLISYLNKRFDLFKNNFDISCDKDILETLSKVGFNVSHNGTLYLAETIKVASTKKYTKMKVLYENVSKTFKTRACNVDWAITNSVESAYSNDRNGKMERFFKIYDGRKPTPKFIIEYFVKILEVNKNS